MPLPLKPIRAILEENCPYHISEEAVIELKKIIEYAIEDISKEAVKLFEKRNKARYDKGLRPLKRLDVWSIHNSSINFLKTKSIIYKGLRTGRIVTPGGTMNKDPNTTKPETTNGPEEVE